MQILYFGKLKEQIENTSFNGKFPITVKALKTALNAKEPKIDFLSTSVLCAVNQTIVDDNTIINSSDEVAFFPPTTGG